MSRDVILMCDREWREIKSAPRDGTEILVKCKGGLICVASFDNLRSEWCDTRMYEPLMSVKKWMPLPVDGGVEDD